jgi:hypothetical protein
MRHKNNMSNILLYDQSLFYNFDLTNTSKYKTFNFSPGQVYTYAGISLPSSQYKLGFTGKTFNFIHYHSFFSNLLKDLLYFLQVPTLITISTILNSINYLQTSITNMLYINTPSVMNIMSFFPTMKENPSKFKNSDVYTSATTNYTPFHSLSSSSFAENSSS